MGFYSDIEEWYSRNGISISQFYEDNSPEVGRELMLKDFIEKQLYKTSYEEIVRSIKEAPMTYMPALLSEILESCVKKKCFIDKNRMMDFIDKRVRSTTY